MKETNMEHYRGEIEEAGYMFGIADGKIVGCDEISCITCGFGRLKCVSGRIKWLMSEYKPEPVLTAREKHFVEFAQEGWLARDEDGELYLFVAKPQKKALCWNIAGIHVRLKAFGDIFPFITWEDEEPWVVADLRKLKVEGGEADET